MSTYCISDIHGNLEMFKKMLQKIEFKYNGEDMLYILGDMVDWGKDSLATLLFCKELDEKYSFFNVLIGNHEYMMLKCLKKCSIRDNFHEDNYYAFTMEIYRSTSWSLNRSIETFNDFLLMEKKEQNEIINYLNRLEYYKEIIVNNKRFYLTHSDCKPIMLNKKQASCFSTPEEFMIWNRVPLGINRLVEVYGKSYQNVTLVHGHTIVDYYGSVDKDGNPMILFDNLGSCICIDCGCKGVGYSFFTHKCNSSLGCIRLEDLKTYYIREN
jgi:serine/threonine protein phosphatase 1